MAASSTSLRVLIVTPEVARLPIGPGHSSGFLNARAGRLGDQTALLIRALQLHGVDVHVTLPDYRAIFNDGLPPQLLRRPGPMRNCPPGERIHLAQDRAFFYLNRIYGENAFETLRISLAFQREVINNIIPRVQPDLIHCHDWITGLLPAMSREQGIPCVFTLHGVHSAKCFLAAIEDQGIDAERFWQHLYFDRFPAGYEAVRASVPVDLLTSGIFAADAVTTVGEACLSDALKGRPNEIGPELGGVLRNKWRAGRVVGIAPAPDPDCHPSVDDSLIANYGADNYVRGKQINKTVVQKLFGLALDTRSPLIFCPPAEPTDRPDGRMLTEALAAAVRRHQSRGLAAVLIADGAVLADVKRFLRQQHLQGRIAVGSENERLTRLAYAAADFVLLPQFPAFGCIEPMMAAIYGTLPIAFQPGEMRDGIRPLDLRRNTGNGFVFKVLSTEALGDAVDGAMAFYARPAAARKRQVQRIMRESAADFSLQSIGRRYLDLYRNVFQRPSAAAPEKAKHDPARIAARVSFNPAGIPRAPAGVGA
jgi:starch synthase